MRRLVDSVYTFQKELGELLSKHNASITIDSGIGCRNIYTDIYLNVGKQHLHIIKDVQNEESTITIDENTTKDDLTLFDDLTSKLNDFKTQCDNRGIKLTNCEIIKKL